MVERESGGKSGPQTQLCAAALDYCYNYRQFVHPVDAGRGDAQRAPAVGGHESDLGGAEVEALGRAQCGEGWSAVEDRSTKRGIGSRARQAGARDSCRRQTVSTAARCICVGETGGQVRVAIPSSNRRRAQLCLHGGRNRRVGRQDLLGVFAPGAVWKWRGKLEMYSAGRGRRVQWRQPRREGRGEGQQQQRGSAGRQKEATSQQPSSLSGWWVAEAKLRELGPKQPMNHSPPPNA